MGQSNYARKNLLALLFQKTSAFGTASTPPTIHVGWSSTKPNADGTNVTEPSGGGYARKATVAGDWNDPTDADPSIIDNANVLAFPVPSADWLSGVELPYSVLYDAATLGNFIDWGTVAQPRKVLNGDPAPTIPAGQISIELGDEDG